MTQQSKRTGIPIFSVGSRYEFIRQSVSLVAHRCATSCIVTGPAGIGKSSEVLNTLEALGATYELIKGQSTAKGLFDALNRNSDGLIAFDDCDSILEDRVAVNLLKGALDSGKVRDIAWYNGQELYRTTFTGGIIFISNKTTIPETLRSRAFCVELDLTREEILERLKELLDTWQGDYTKELKLEAFGVLEEYHQSLRTFNFRSLDKILRCYHPTNPHWKQLALYHLTNE